MSMTGRQSHRQNANSIYCTYIVSHGKNELFTHVRGSYVVQLLMVCMKVMTAASYWSLLKPAIETASLSGVYGEDGQYAFIPVSFGFAAGAAFVYAADYCLAMMVL